MIDSMEQQGVNQQNPVEKAQCLRLLQQEQQLSMFLAQGSGESHGNLVSHLVAFCSNF